MKQVYHLTILKAGGFMERADEGLPFLLKYENVADYRNGEVWILDRRAYPAREEFVRCVNYHDVATAIANMVTQSGGPWLAAALGMVSAVEAQKNSLRNGQRKS